MNFFVHIFHINDINTFLFIITTNLNYICVTLLTLHYKYLSSYNPSIKKEEKKNKYKDKKLLLTIEKKRELNLKI